MQYLLALIFAIVCLIGILSALMSALAPYMAQITQGLSALSRILGGG